jgi:maltose O-acetyltransferase
MINKKYYCKVPSGLLLLNWIVQRIFGVNREVPFSVHYTNSVKGFNNIKMTEDVKLNFAVSGGANIFIFDGTTLEIGEKTIWSFGLCIQTGDHDLQDRNKFHLSSVKIGKNCWLGHGVTILKGVELGDNVTVAANSVVTGSFPANVVIAGVPAKIIKQV